MVTGETSLRNNREDLAEALSETAWDRGSLGTLEGAPPPPDTAFNRHRDRVAAHVDHTHNVGLATLLSMRGVCGPSNRGVSVSPPRLQISHTTVQYRVPLTSRAATADRSHLSPKRHRRRRTPPPPPSSPLVLSAARPRAAGPHSAHHSWQRRLVALRLRVAAPHACFGRPASAPGDGPSSPDPVWVAFRVLPRRKEGFVGVRWRTGGSLNCRK